MRRNVFDRDHPKRMAIPLAGFGLQTGPAFMIQGLFTARQVDPILRAAFAGPRGLELAVYPPIQTWTSHIFSRHFD